MPQKLSLYLAQKIQKMHIYPYMPVNAHANFTIFWVTNGPMGFPPLLYNLQMLEINAT